MHTNNSQKTALNLKNKLGKCLQSFENEPKQSSVNFKWSLYRHNLQFLIFLEFCKKLKKPVCAYQNNDYLIVV